MKTTTISLLAIAFVTCLNHSSAQWTQVTGISVNVNAIAIQSNGCLYAGTTNDGVYWTTDNGGSWTLVLGQLYGVYKVFSLSIDPSGNVFAGTGGKGLLRSTDQGHAWTYLCNDAPGNNMPQSDVYAVAINSSGAILACDFGSVYRSTDGGSSWLDVRHSTSGVNGLRSLACGRSDSVYACGISDWFYYSVNGGSTWSWAGSGSGLTGPPYTLAVNSKGFVYAGTQGGGVFRSMDGGLHWNAMNTGLTNFNINTIAAAVTGNIFAGTSSGVFVSTDDGSNWTATNGGLTHTDIRAIAADLAGHVYAGAYTGSNTGGLWELATPLPVQLSSFIATRVAAGGVNLEWTTISEVDNYGFEVEKSGEPHSGYSTIAKSFVPGHGTTLETHVYRFTDDSPAPGASYYRLKQTDLDGAVHYTEGVRVDVVAGVTKERQNAREFTLYQNHPNPFNPSTTIRYSLPAPSLVVLSVYNALGQQVAELVHREEGAGIHEVTLDASNLATGMYFYRLQAGSFLQTRRLLLVR